MNEEIYIDVFKELVNHSGKVAFAFDVETSTFNFLSDGFEQMWGLPKEYLFGDPSCIVATVHPDDKEYIIKEYTELLNGDAKNKVEFRIILPDENIKYLLTSVQMIKDTDGKKHLAGLLEDVTNLKENISTLQRFAAKKDAILEVLSHDLAGPLATIKTLANLLQEHLKDHKNGELDNIVKIIYESSARSIRLIREFVDQEFLESTNPGLLKVRMNLVEKVQEVLDEFMEAEDFLNKKFRFSASSQHIYVYIDQGKFMQVVNNIISNSIKFTHDGGVIRVDLQEYEDTVLLTFRDNGIGIPEKYHSKLFEKFTQARREGLKGEPTIGLGMSIIKTIVEWHGGKIWFESEENVGTAIFIELPKQ